MYHYVRPDAPGPYFHYLHTDDFREQLRFFARTHGVAPREDFIRAAREGRSVDGCVFTFDDGFADHFDHALPILREMGMWGIFYVPTGIHDGRRRPLDVHRVHLLLGRTPPAVLLTELRELIAPHMLVDAGVEAFRDATYVHQRNDEATAEFKRVLNYYIAPEWRAHVLEALIARHFPEGEEALWRDLYMTPEQIGALQQAGMIVGNHGVSHSVMSRLSLEEQRREIDEAFDTLDRFTGGLEVKTFCYPYGGSHSYTADTIALLNERDCLFSFDFDPRDITDDDLRSRRQTLPRFDCNQFPHGQAQRGPRA